MYTASIPAADWPQNSSMRDFGDRTALPPFFSFMSVEDHEGRNGNDVQDHDDDHGGNDCAVRTADIVRI